jgi:ABC-type nitrate/sulfonate/bicarbonate transport system substrate-binding protein
MARARRLSALLASVALAIACAPGAPPALTPSPAATATAARPAATATPARAAAAAASPSPAARATPPPGTAVSLTLPSQGMDFVYVAAARSRGYFAEEGLDVGTEVAIATVGVKAILARQYDFTGSAASSQEAIAQGAPLKVVMVAQDRPTYGFFAKPSIPTIRDLRGMNLGITSVGTPAQIMANTVLRRNGLDPARDVTWVGLGPPQNLWTALKAGAVDAGMVGTADLARPARDGFVDLKVYDDPGLRNASVGLATSDRLLAEKPDVVRRMIRALAKGTRFVAADRAGTLPILVELAGIDRATAGELYDLTVDRFIPAGHIPESEQVLSLDVVRQGLELKDPIPPVWVFDFRLAREVNDELTRAAWKP